MRGGRVVIPVDMTWLALRTALFAATCYAAFVVASVVAGLAGQLPEEALGIQARNAFALTGTALRIGVFPWAALMAAAFFATERSARLAASLLALAFLLHGLGFAVMGPNPYHSGRFGFVFLPLEGFALLALLMRDLRPARTA